jgi:DNA-binding transcriptional ArsR family regulator
MTLYAFGFGIRRTCAMTMPRDAGSQIDLRRMRTMYRALGDETRLQIISLLAEHRQLPVNELSARVGLSQPLISWHLRILRLADLISTQRHGRETLCTLRLAAFAELREAEARLISGTSGIAESAPSPTGEIPDVG